MLNYSKLFNLSVYHNNYHVTLFSDIIPNRDFCGVCRISKAEKEISFCQSHKTSFTQKKNKRFVFELNIF